MSDLLAYHESGHALVAWLLGGEVERVTIEPDNDDDSGDDRPAREGVTQVLWPRDRSSEREFAAKAVQVCLAGPVAEMIYSGDPFHPGLVAEWADDWRQAWQAALPLFSDERRRLAHLERITVELHRLLRRDDVWAALAALADELAAHETLDGEQVSEIVGEWLN